LQKNFFSEIEKLYLLCIFAKVDTLKAERHSHSQIHFRKITLGI